MTDYPKADRLRQQREERFEREQARQKAQRVCIDCGVAIKAGKRCKPCGSEAFEKNKLVYDARRKRKPRP